jgi:Cu/Ag efflux protein CusF
MPPRQVMRQLNYKSVDSMLKREPIAQLFVAWKIIETEAWQQKFIRAYKTLKPSDFETRPITIIMIKNSRWQTMTDYFVRKNKHNIASAKDIGAVVILPMPVNDLPGLTTAVLSMLLREINELRSLSSYLKLEQVKPNFSLIASRALLSGLSASSLNVAGQRFPWRVIQQYFGSLKIDEHSEIFGPHLQPEDLAWSKPEDVLYHLEPALKFWEDLGYVAAMFDGRPVSFNLLDNAVSNCNQLNYGHQVSGHFRQNLRSELYRRYLAQTSLGEQTLNRLDDNLVGLKREFTEKVGA